MTTENLTTESLKFGWWLECGRANQVEFYAAVRAAMALVDGGVRDRLALLLPKDCCGDVI